jgi:type II secretory pathway pseudopilin PulG
VTPAPRGEAGFTLPELLVGMTTMLVVLVAVLASFESFLGVQRADERRTIAQDGVRRAVDHLERQLRNLATPAPGVPSIARATATDLVFQTADPQKRWVRYCIDPQDPGAASGGARLWYQTISNASAPPTGADCPHAAGWSSTTAVAEAIVNVRGGVVRPLFSYDWPRDADGAEVHADTAAVTRIATDVRVDEDPGRAPAEPRLTSGVFLRNQNQQPVAAFSVTRTASGLVLNGSATTDAEGQGLDYRWYAGTRTGFADGCVPAAADLSSYLGTGVVLNVAPPAGTAPPTSVTLCVADPGGLTDVVARAVPVA